MHNRYIYLVLVIDQEQSEQSGVPYAPIIHRGGLYKHR
jgi:hypothetical protein